MFEFTEEQEKFRSFLKKFTREEVLPMAAQVDQENDIPWEFRKKMAANTIAYIPNKGCTFMIFP